MINNSLYTPSKASFESSQMWQFCLAINKKYRLAIGSYSELYDWSIQNPELFWDNCASFCGMTFSQPPTSIVSNIYQMPGTKWFSGATLNYAQHCLKSTNATIHELNESGHCRTLSSQEL